MSFDPVQAFSGRAEAENGSLPSEVALREAIEHEETYVTDATQNWRRLAEDGDEAEFVHGKLSGTLAWVSLKLVEGRWRSTGGSSDCEPTSIVGHGPVTTWTLADPEKPEPNAAGRHVEIDLGPGDCSSGLPQNPRARIVFRKWGRKLLMTVWLKPLPEGTYSCVGISEPPLKVTLPSKIKLDRLYDAATYPPRPAVPPVHEAG